MSNAEFIRDLAARMFRNATPAMGFDQGDTDRLYVIANRLAALEQAGEPVAGIGHGEEADYAELKRLYNFSDDDSAQFTRWNMLTAIRHGKRLGQEFDAGEGISEAEALALREPNDDDRAVAENIYKAQRDRGAFCSSEVAALIASYRAMVTLDLAHPPQSRAQAFDGEGEGFAIGDPVEKFTGEAIWHGTIAASYLTSKGKRRYVVEVEPQGFQMIAVPSQLRALSSAKRGEEG
ncbi:hypothetical protein AX777_04915 [Sphingobium yanoikuyae]|uniref:Uncharacterized protein n=2 Tax=Sphingobium yanoikuyae TaxID=13690 RepID=A0A177JN25_SPHYA|nr:hypothetical protein AX777_04915 [Sphingobium yanoikuyae]